MTIHDKLVKALLMRGYSIVEAKTRKYTVVRGRPYQDGGERFYYVGKAGALRVGPTVSGSRSMPRARAELLAEYAAADRG